MKTLKYIVEVKLPDNDWISSNYIASIIEEDLNYEDTKALQRKYIVKAIFEEDAPKKIELSKYQKLRKLAMDMYTKAHYLTTDTRGLRAALRNFHKYIILEEKK